MTEKDYGPPVKVFFEPPDDPEQDWHTEVESMWAKPLRESGAPDGVVFELDNSPWYVFGVSAEDLVCAESRHEVYEEPEYFECDVLYFTRVWKHSGHSTYAIILLNGETTESERWKFYWSQLSTLGCSYEGATKKLLSVDVLPQSDLEAVEAVFEEALAEGIFEYQTQHRFNEKAN